MYRLELVAKDQSLTPHVYGPDAKIVLTVTPAEGKAEQARFQLGAKPDHKGHKH